PLTRPNYRLKQLDPNHRTSPGTWSPGRTTSAPLKQHRACILDAARACGQSPDSPVEPSCPLKNAKETVFLAAKMSFPAPYHVTVNNWSPAKNYPMSNARQLVPFSL